MENNFESVVFVGKEKPKYLEYRDVYKKDLELTHSAGLSRGMAFGKGNKEFDGNDY